MLAGKHITKIIALVMAVAVAACLIAVAFADELTRALGGTGVHLAYEDTLFDTDEVLQVNILMQEDEWQSMLDNALSEQYSVCDVEINGESFYRVGIRPKGNTSLSTIASDPDTDRYSFKLEFDQYVDGQTCYGLDKLILNNNYADATLMKEALIYDMYHYLGADAALYNYAQVFVNGEYWGLYLALEAVEDSFMLRNYGAGEGELYKPDSMELGGIGGGKGGFSSGGGGADLNYTDSDLDSYATIWQSAVTATTEADHRRVVTALEHIANGTDLEKYMDIDNLLKYAAVHIFSVNADSLSGSMTHNYYLYEHNGRLNLIPWDYNLALGGMGSGRDATSTVNSPIDDAWNATNFFDTLLANEQYAAQYHAYLAQLAQEYVLDGAFDRFYTSTRARIDALAEKDPNAFYSYDEYLSATETFVQVVRLRGQSVLGQTDGSIPSTSAAQRNSDALIDASDLDLSLMGTMNMGGGGFGGGFGGGNMTPPTNSPTATTPGEQAPTAAQMPDNVEPPSSDDQFPGSFDPSTLPEGFDPSQFGGGGNRPGGTTGNGDATGGMSRPDSGDMGQFPGMMNPSNSAITLSNGTLALYGLCAAVLLGGLLFALLFRRRIRK